MSFGNPDNSGSIAADSDVTLGSPSGGQVLTYDSGDDKWKNLAATPGVVQLDSFSGATDDDKLTAALSYAQTQTYIPAIQFPNRTVTLSQTRIPFSGMKLIGPGAPGGPKNLELSSGKFSNSKVELNVGNGTASWMVATGTVYDIYIGNIAFQGGSSSQFWHQPLSTAPGLYAAQFDALTFYGFQHVFGQPSNQAALTQVFFTGHWQVIGPNDVQFCIAGSDNAFWTAGYLNIGGNPSVDGANRFLIELSVGKTDVGKIYVTCNNGWLGVKCTGDLGGLNFFGGDFEGQNINNPCYGSVIRVEGGGVSFCGPWTAYAMSNPGTYSHGVIEVTGGNVLVDRPTYERGNTAASVPYVYCSGGKIEVRSAYGMQDTCIAHSAGGTIVVDSSVITN